MGHLVAGFYKDLTAAQKPWYKGGHPFEAWMETQISNNNKEIPSAYLARLMAAPPAFSKLNDYWDTGMCEPTGAAQWQGDSSGWPATGFGNPPPEKSWGLAESTNYQFLSYSTIFKDSGLQSFPHPAKEHTRVDWYPTGPDGERQYYRLGYDVPHLARVTYTTFYAWIIPIYTVDTTTTEEERVYEDYAKRTISRTVDYTTSLINYFFRGKLSVKLNYLTSEEIELNITNESKNSGTNQSLKGGIFELYWDNPDGNRTKVTGFTAFDSNNPLDNDVWCSSCTLAYGNAIRAKFLKPQGAVEKFILVYKGNICENPNALDSDDSEAMATDIIDNPGSPFASNDCCCFLNPSTTSWDTNTIYGVDNLVEYSGFTYKSNADENINHRPSNEPAWWTKVSNTVSCGNPYWNEWPPYGGVGKTPKYIIAAFSGITLCTGGEFIPPVYPKNPPGPNRSFILTQSGSCNYSCWLTDTMYIDGHPYRATYGIDLTLSGSLSVNVYYCPFPWELGHQYNQGDIIIHTWTEEDIDLFSCNLTHISTAENEPGVGVNTGAYWHKWDRHDYQGIGCFQDEGCSECGDRVRWFGSTSLFSTSMSNCPQFNTTLNNTFTECRDGQMGMQIGGYGGTATIIPGNDISVSGWEVSHSYVIGNLVHGTDGKTYICKLNHISSSSNQPIIGGNWSTYWWPFDCCL